MKPLYMILLALVLFFFCFEGLVMVFVPASLTVGVQGPLILRVGLVVGIVLFAFLAFRRRNLVSLFFAFGLVALVFASPLWIGSGIQGRFVGAYYYGWYTQEDFAGMLDQPLQGAYDSTDLTVLRQQLKWAGEAEIDFLALSGFIEDAPYLDLVWQNAEAMFHENEERDYPVQLCFMLEPRSFDGLAGMAEHVWQNYAETEAYFCYQGKPLLFIFDGYIPSDLPLYVERLQSFTVRTTVDSPYSSIESQTTYVGDVVAVMPGFERPDWPDVYVPRDGGQHYREQWQTALVLSAANLNRPLIVMVTSWNEYWENTHIEASVNYGDAYLNMTKEYAMQLKQK